MKTNRNSIHMTKGNITRTLITFAIPILIGNIFQQLYNMVDTAVVGRCIGSDALAAVGTTTPVITLILGLMIGMSNGISVVVAQYVGSGDTGKTRKAIGNGLLLMLVLSVIITILGITLTPSLFSLMNVPNEIRPDALIYAYTLFIGTFSNAAYNYEAGVLRAFGNSFLPLVFLILTSILNGGMDVLFVQGFGMGVFGAALATILSQLCSAVLCFLYILKKVPEIHIFKADLSPDTSMIRKNFVTGLPMALSQSCLGISFLVAQTGLNTLGAASISAYTAASKMDSLSYMMMGAFGSTISTFAAQNYGNKQYARVRQGVRKSLWITVIVAIALMACAQLFGKNFMILFVGGNEPNILKMGIQYIRISSLFYLSQCCDFILQYALVGVGQTIASTLVCISEIMTRVAATYLLVYRLGFYGMIFVSPCCWTISSLLLIVIYRPMMKKSGVISKK